jgi:hypothetical protein
MIWNFLKESFKKFSIQEIQNFSTVFVEIPQIKKKPQEI